MKYFITDIHGDYRGLELLLKQADIDFTADQLVFGGDYIDRGKESGKVLKKIKELADAYPGNVIALMGNHEEMMRDYYQLGDKLWLHHGGREALKDLEKCFPQESERNEHIAWACQLPLVYEDDEFVYTHAGLNPHEPLEKQGRDILWITESEFYGIPKDRLLALTRGKPVVHGHTPVERIYYDAVRMNCDLGSNTYFLEEERGLALVNLSQMSYVVYKQHIRKLEQRTIARF